ncbi:unnamed protein product [Prorocentrum cordatum]|uniref:Rhodanese domain-containing protein n=1 Tax=Prorocentrum cordatum TaxID=2364126 RepID=A0ABN9VQ61_9DINO|nr:unnamed protein product [Polarella glacialis]
MLGKGGFGVVTEQFTCNFARHLVYCRNQPCLVISGSFEMELVYKRGISGLYRAHTARRHGLLNASELDGAFNEFVREGTPATPAGAPRAAAEGLLAGAAGVACAARGRAGARRGPRGRRVGAPERRTAGPASPRVARRQGQRRLHDMPDAVGTVERAGGEVPFRHPPRSERASYRLRFGAQRFWDLTVYPKAIFPWSPEYGGRPLSALTKNHIFRLKFIGTIHVLALGAPFCFSWGAFRIFLITMAIAI